MKGRARNPNRDLKRKSPVLFDPDVFVQARKMAGYSQTQLAELINATQSSVGDWELGRTTPRPEKWSQLAELLNLPDGFFTSRNLPAGQVVPFPRKAPNMSRADVLALHRMLSGSMLDESAKRDLAYSSILQVIALVLARVPLMEDNSSSGVGGLEEDAL